MNVSLQNTFYQVYLGIIKRLFMTLSNKIFKFVLFITLIFGISNNLYSASYVENKANKKETSAQIFYKQNPHRFVTLKLFNEPKERFYSLQTIIRSTAFLALFSVVSVCGMGLLINQTRDFNWREGEIITTIAILLLIPAAIGSTTWYVLRSKKLEYINALRKFLDKYDSDLDESELKNNKLYTPKEFYPVLDSLSKKYNKQGDFYLSKKGLKILKLLFGVSV